AALLARPAAALEPDEVLILVRGAGLDAKPLLDHYRALRPVPAENVLGLPLGGGETIDRAEFERSALAPLRRELARPERAKIRCLLCLRGLPLRVGAAEIPGASAKQRESTVASFDSEIALALAPPPSLEGYARNPLFRPGPLAAPAAILGPQRPLMVARLDA